MWGALLFFSVTLLFLCGLYLYLITPHHFESFEMLPLMVLVLTAWGMSIWLNRKIFLSFRQSIHKVRRMFSVIEVTNKPTEEKGVLGDNLEKVKRDPTDKSDDLKLVKSRLIALSAITTAVNQTTNVDQILSDVLGIILEVTAYDGGVIFLREEADRRLVLRAGKGVLLEMVWKFDQVESVRDSTPFPVFEELFREAERRKQIILISNVEEIGFKSETSGPGAQRIDGLSGRGIKILALIPLLAKGKMLGLMALTGSTSHQPSLEENEFLEAIGLQMGMTIENINLLSGWTKKAHDLTILNETLSTFSASLKLNQISYVLTQQVMKSLSADFGWVALLDQKKENLILETSIFGTGEVSSRGYSDDKSYEPDQNDEYRATALKGTKTVSILPLKDLPFHDRAIQSGRLVKFDYVDQFNSIEKQFLPFRTKGEVVLIPFAIGNRSLGVVGAGAKDARKLNCENLNLCQSIASQAAFAMENSLLYEDVKQKAEEVSSLYEVGQRLSSILDLDELLKQILKVVVESFGYLNCAILLVDKGNQELYIKAAHGFSSDHIHDLRIKIGQEGITGWVAKTGESLVVGDVSQEPRYVSGKEGCRSEIAVPLKLKGEIMGVLDAESEKLFAFGDKDIRILTQLASQIAVVLENSSLFSEERKSNLKLALINDVGRKVVSTLNLDKLLESTIEVIQLSLKYDNISLFLAEEAGEDLILKSYCGRSGNMVQPGYRHKIGMGMVGKAAEARKTILCNDVTKEPSYIPAIADTLSELCVPIKSGRTVVGILDVESFSKNMFDKQDVAVLETIADLLASAIQNTKLYNDTRRKAWRLELVDQINRAISSTLDLKGVFRIVSTELNKVVDYDRINLSFWHPHQRLFSMELSFCPKDTLTCREIKYIPAEETNLYQVTCTRKPFYREKLVLNSESNSEDQLLYAEGVRSYVLIPIRDNENVTAVLGLENTKDRGFEKDQIQLMNSIADHLSVALQNAKLFSDLEEAYQNLKSTQSHMIQIERFRALGEMASGVVHDFNNILASILGRVQLLLLKLKKGEKSISSETEMSLQVIEKSVMDGAKILSRIREFVKQSSDKPYAPVDLNALIEDSLEMTRAYWRDEAFLSGIQMEIKKELNSNSMVRGDATELREVLTNLLLNAGDAMPQGGTLTLITKEDREHIYLTVKDTGTGMTEEIKNKIFVPFYTTKGEKGTGLGLSLAYGIVTSHQGEISVESAPGQGSTFTIKLPRCDRVEDKETNLIPDRGGAHILVVEDEKNIREVLEEILSSAGHTVSQAETGEEGIQLFKTRKIDLVITDLGMPGMSGWELADKIKDLNPHTPVILSTGWGVKIHPSSQKRENVDLVINKPFNMQQILSNIGELLSQKRVSSKEQVGERQPAVV
jgi:GAF domain-containing protein/ActR/RegA family two-component response regulator/anti-sigma regulatory factor (Ser/Thr protein kinase)